MTTSKNKLTIKEYLNADVSDYCLGDLNLEDSQWEKAQKIFVEKVK
jgi:hypothetical protein